MPKEFAYLIPTANICKVEKVNDAVGGLAISIFGAKGTKNGLAALRAHP